MELLVGAMVAVLATMLVFFCGYVQWAKNTSDQKTLLVLNDALNGYKWKAAM